MISLDNFLRYLKNGVIPKLNFFYETNEYAIERVTDGETVSYAFAREDGEPEIYATTDELVQSVYVSSLTLAEIWNSIKPIGGDTLAD
ncbi:MAG: hypothetical protein K2N18_04990, partial [Clostridia bacterium]|nr:hypothetical protein [Clostridia bacterium]